MAMMLKADQVVEIQRLQTYGRVTGILGSGGQGQVFRVSINGDDMAVKWYDPTYIQKDKTLKSRLEDAIQTGRPSDRFLWPIALATSPGTPGFGYIMPFMSQNFKSSAQIMNRILDLSFREIATVGVELSQSLLMLHAKGYFYGDLSFRNVFVDPRSCQIRICDNDNVDRNGQKGWVGGTIDFSAPEIIMKQAHPSMQSDLFSLANFLFYLLFLQHPLEGRAAHEIRCLNEAAKTLLYGEDPVFIFDPENTSNRPLDNDNAIIFWDIYPSFIKEMFVRSFTTGLTQPSARVVDSEWIIAMAKLRDAVIDCENCGAQQFYESINSTVTCWNTNCRSIIKYPYMLRFDDGSTVSVNLSTCLYPHHTHARGRGRFDFSRIESDVVRQPNNRRVLCLRNLGRSTWFVSEPDGPVSTIKKGELVPVKVGTYIKFEGRAATIVR
jgi:eukaryotic-like serine/threonine-protein kinase